MRALVYSLLTATLVAFYGARVCPVIEAASRVHWLIALFLIFAAMWGLRAALLPVLVTSRSGDVQSLRQLGLDLGLFLLAAIASGVYPVLAFGSPEANGVKVFVGAVALGFYFSLELALQRERVVVLDARRRGIDWRLTSPYLPVTRKFGFLAGACVIFTTLIVAAVVIKDVHENFHLAPGADYWAVAMVWVAKDLLFVMACLTGAATLVITSFATNLRLFFGFQSEAMDAVSQGDLRARVPVVTNDEFGLIARRTNSMIAALEQRTSELALAQLAEEKSKLLAGLSASLSKYLSPQIVQSLLTGEKGTDLVTQRKKLTVFFSDIKDFTKTTEDMQPEDLSYLLNSYFTEMSKIALHYGATIDKFIGDAMLMFFGDPGTRGVREDAEACVRMAVAMQRRMKKLQEIWRGQGYNNPFHMRIGVNTGFCNVGNFGSEDRMDYTIIGGEVNLAARLEVQAEPDGILISADTYALVRDIVEAEERPKLTAKGIEREVIPYAITNIYDEGLGSSDLIRKEFKGLRIIADLEQVSAEDKGAILESMEELMARLREKPAAGPE